MEGPLPVLKELPYREKALTFEVGSRVWHERSVVWRNLAGVVVMPPRYNSRASGEMLTLFRGQTVLSKFSRAFEEVFGPMQMSVLRHQIGPCIELFLHR